MKEKGLDHTFFSFSNLREKPLLQRSGTVCLQPAEGGACKRPLPGAHGPNAPLAVPSGLPPPRLSHTGCRREDAENGGDTSRELAHRPREQRTLGGLDLGRRHDGPPEDGAQPSLRTCSLGKGGCSFSRWRGSPQRSHGLTAEGTSQLQGFRRGDVRSWPPGSRERTRCLSSSLPGLRTPTAGNEAEPSQRGVRAVIHSGNLRCVPPEGQAPQSRGRTQAGEEAAAPIPSRCRGQAGRGGLRESL